MARDFEKSDESLLLGFLDINLCDLTQLENWLRGWSYIVSKLAPEPEPDATRATDNPLVREVIVPEVQDGSPEGRNPYDKMKEPLKHSRWYRTDEYKELDRKQAVSDSVAEILPAWQAWIQEIAIAAGGWEVPAQCLKQCWQLVSRGDNRFPFTRDGVRRAWFYL